MQSYRQELEKLHHRRTYYILIVCSCMILMFSGLDTIMADEHFEEFLYYRLTAALVGVVLLLLNYRDRKYHYAILVGFFAYLCVSSTLLLMIYRMGGATSPYYVGLLITIAIYSTLAPLTWLQTLGSGSIIIFGYALVAISAGTGSPEVLIELFSNLFFMICFVFIVATFGWVGERARKREYLLRKEEKEAAEKLADQAVILEEEVLKRSKEQAASEERYRQLFNQIADDVVVVDQRGEILQSNTSFDRNYAALETSIGKSFFDLICEGERKNVQKALAAMIDGNQPLAAYQISLVKRDGTLTNMEINASPLIRDEEFFGTLIILRDTITRRKLERKLIESLEKKRKTETAAILALARLSEFKDAMAGHHLERIREYCRVLTSELLLGKEYREEMTPEFLEDIYNACILHDIGKVALPDEILDRRKQPPGPEGEQVRQHTIIGCDIIRGMKEESKGAGFLSMAEHIACFHHERWDGKGYPHGLAEKEIPLAARIMAVANTYEEMTAGTGHNRMTLLHRDVVNHINDNKGRRFDPLVVKAFLARQQEFAAIRQKFAGQGI